MEFFYGQDTLSTIQWTLRAIVAFFFLFFVVKIMGLRSISQLRLLDFAMAILIGNIIAHPLSDEGLGLKGSLVSMSVLAGLYLICLYLMSKFTPFREFVAPPPISLVKNGELNLKNLKKARISVDDILSEMRKQSIVDLKKVALALWEPDGEISFFLSPEHQPVTKSDLNITSQPFSYPTAIIKEGKINYEMLINSPYNKETLKNNIKTTYNVEINEVLLATLDQNNQLQVFLK
ncbi:DUF421 domain-containing protein [Lysinibacillus fusiformis]|uniref:DUF421 domain-containing protein n=1 Tax=Lysinibacillus fusiformis TaxID=28031 RepID=UPI0035591B72